MVINDQFSYLYTVPTLTSPAPPRGHRYFSIRWMFIYLVCLELYSAGGRRDSRARARTDRSRLRRERANTRAIYLPRPHSRRQCRSGGARPVRIWTAIGRENRRTGGMMKKRTVNISMQVFGWLSFLITSSSVCLLFLYDKKNSALWQYVRICLLKMRILELVANK